MMPEECIQIAVSLHGAEPALAAFGWKLFQCCAVLAGGMIVAAFIRALGRSN